MFFYILFYVVASNLEVFSSAYPASGMDIKPILDLLDVFGSFLFREFSANYYHPFNLLIAAWESVVAPPCRT